ncbi:hypothetical protein BaRGS_00031312, partial [Batillaria attramentaria]
CVRERKSPCAAWLHGVSCFAVQGESEDSLDYQWKQQHDDEMPHKLCATHSVTLPASEAAVGSKPTSVCTFPYLTIPVCPPLREGDQAAMQGLFFVELFQQFDHSCPIQRVFAVLGSRQCQRIGTKPWSS